MLQCTSICVDATLLYVPCAKCGPCAVLQPYSMGPAALQWSRSMCPLQCICVGVLRPCAVCCAAPSALPCTVPHSHCISPAAAPPRRGCLADCLVLQVSGWAAAAQVRRMAAHSGPQQQYFVDNAPRAPTRRAAAHAPPHELRGALRLPGGVAWPSAVVAVAAALLGLAVLCKSRLSYRRVPFLPLVMPHRELPAPGAPAPRIAMATSTGETQRQMSPEEAEALAKWYALPAEERRGFAARALAANPADTDAAFALYEACDQLGLKQESIEALQKCVAADPNHAAARHLLTAMGQAPASATPPEGYVQQVVAPLGMRVMGGALDGARAVRLFGGICGKSVVLSVGFVLLCRVPLRTYLFGTAKGHNGPRATSKIVKWVPMVLCA